MQNRYIPADDLRGMGEYLEERDEFGNPIRVPATYYVQITDEAKGQNSTQRLIQQRTDMPPQVFYSFNKTGDSEIDQASSFPTMEAFENLDLPTLFQMAGINETVKMVSLPLSLNTLVIRLENIADLYDKDASSVTIEFKELLTNMWHSANSDSNAQAEFDIQEMSLTANMNLEQMEARRIKWKTVDDPKEEYEQSKVAKDDGFDLVKLEPQRIRTFMVKFKHQKSVEIL